MGEADQQDQTLMGASDMKFKVVTSLSSNRYRGHTVPTVHRSWLLKGLIVLLWNPQLCSDILSCFLVLSVLSSCLSDSPPCWLIVCITLSPLWEVGITHPLRQ